MSASVDIRDEITPALAGLQQAVRADVQKGIATAVEEMFKANFLALGTNKRNWPSTGFWAQAARSTNYDLLVDSIVINVTQVGVRQRLEGGEIHREGGGYLTIPARAEAYGKRASEFNNLHAVFFKTGHGFFAALVEANRTAVKIGKQKKDGTRTTTRGAESGGGVMFWLVKSVTQAANPNVIPSAEAITAVAISTATGIITRAAARGGKA